MMEGKEIDTSDEKKVMHFSDGTVEIVESATVELQATEPPVTLDPKSLDWAPWAFHMTKQAGSRALDVCDYLGESLASFFGITTPKYQFEINEYNKMLKEAEEEKKERDLEMGNWKFNEMETEAVLTPPSSDKARF